MKVSVVIPCYNAEKYIAQTIGSVLEQSKPPAEIIIVDDGSTDGSLAIAEQFNNFVHILRQKQKGAAAARNRGAGEASGDAIMFLDADDVLGPDALEALVSALEREPGTIALCPWFTLQYINGKWIRQSKNSPPRRFGQDDLGAWLSGWFHPPCSVLWSKEALDITGFWDEKVIVNQDGDMMLRAMINDIRLSRTTFGHAYYRRLPRTEKSISDARYTREGLQSRLYVMTKIARLIQQKNKLKQYSSSLAEAFECIAKDAEEKFPELKESSLNHVKEYGGLDLYRKLKIFTFEILSKLERFYNRTIKIGISSDSAVFESEEINYGIRVFEKPMNNKLTPCFNTHKGNLDPKVSVIIPTYNRCELLQDALQSVLKQTFNSFEIIVVDDASQDGTRKLMAENFSEDKRINYLRLEKNSGVSNARNRGLEIARGDYIAFLDSDDKWRKSKLENQVIKFDNLSDETGLLYVASVAIEDENKKRVHSPTHRGNLYNELLLRNVVYPTSGIIIRSCVVDEVGYFDTEIPANEDWDYWIRLSRDFKIDYVDEVLVQYNAISSHVRKSMIFKDDVNARDRIYKKNKIEMRINGTACKFLLESARRQLVPGYWQPKSARDHLWEVIKINPFMTRIYIYLFRSFAPYNLYLFIRSVTRKFFNYNN